MTDNPCPRCGRPIPDSAYVCDHCVRTLAAELREAADLHPDLEAAVSRLVAVGHAGGSGKARGVLHGPRCASCEHASCAATWKSQTRARNEPPQSHEAALPLNAGALEHSRIIENTAGTWARHIAETRGIPLPTVARRPIIGAVTLTQPRDDLRPSRCIFSDLPLAQCACGRPHPKEDRNG